MYSSEDSIIKYLDSVNLVSKVVLRPNYSNHSECVILHSTFQLSTSLSSRVASRLSSDYVDALNMIAMLLPGTPITLYGEEIGMEDASGSVKHPARCVMSWSNATNAGIWNLQSYETQQL